MIAVLCISCDRSDTTSLDEMMPAPKFDESIAAGVKAKHIYDTYGINCQWIFNSDDYAYELIYITDGTPYEACDNMDKVAEFLTAFEEKALKILPKEIVSKAYANVYLCNEIQNKYIKFVSKNAKNSSYTSTEETELLPMKIKNLGVALGFAGSKFDEADMDYLQLRWVEYIFQTMLYSSPVPLEFNRISCFSISELSGYDGQTNYSESERWGWWAIYGAGASGETHKEGGYQYDWGLIDAPNTGLYNIRYAMDGVTEIQIGGSMGNSTFYKDGYTSEMDFATYAAFILLKPASYMDDLCQKYPLVARKTELVKEYFKTNFNYELKSIK